MVNNISFNSFDILDFSNLNGFKEYPVYDQCGFKRGKIASANTTGDGSCGFHALLGQYNEQIQAFHLDDVLFSRLEFSEYLRALFEQGTIPDLIKEAFKLYLENLEDCPDELKDVISKNLNLVQEYKEFIFKDQNDEANNIVEMMLNNVEIQEAYLNHSMGKDTLYEQEVAEAANFYNKNLHVYVNNYGQISGPTIYPCKNLSEETVEILLNGPHFEKAIYYPN